MSDIDKIMQFYDIYVPKIIELIMNNAEGIDSPEYILGFLLKRVHSLCSSTFTMVNKNMYSERNYFIRIIQEHIELMAYIGQNQTESRRWREVQDIKKLKRNKEYERYRNLLNIAYNDYINHLKENDYTEALSQINEKNITDLKFFNPKYLTSVFDFSPYHDQPLEKEIVRSNTKFDNDILSKDIHPTFTLYTGLDYNDEIKFEDKMSTFDRLDLAVTIIIYHFKEKIPENLLDEIKLIQLERLRIFEPEKYERIFKALMLDAHNSLQTTEERKNQIQLLDEVMKDGLLSPTFVNMKTSVKIQKISIPREKQQAIYLHNQFFYYTFSPIMVQLGREKKQFDDDIKKELLIQFALLIVSEIGRTVRSIRYLDSEYRYGESTALLRKIEEEYLLVKYFLKYKHEYMRWIWLQEISKIKLLSTFDPNISKKEINEIRDFFNSYGKMNMNEFKRRLIEGDSPELASSITEQNLYGAKLFTPSYIRNSLEKSISKKEKDHYSYLSEFVHPSLILENLRPGKDIDKEIINYGMSLSYIYMIFAELKIIIDNVEVKDMINYLLEEFHKNIEAQRNLKLNI